ncbi:hypothetical protein HDV01_001268 [Terramyces sp. JEL0728]|nr:hypothetical protein HDV01_001268 [Terramyces sp. JEL0728]
MLSGKQDQAEGINLRSRKAAKEVKKSKAEHEVESKEEKATNWEISNWTVAGCFFMMAFCPTIVLFFWLACDSFQCSVVSPVEFVFGNGWDQFVMNYFPKPTVYGFQLFFGCGQMTPAGHKLPYVVNGLLAWIVTHALFLIGSLRYGLFNASIIADNWGSLMIAATAYGYFLTGFAYFKAHVFPSHPADRKFSNSVMYDLFMGIEFNPRFGKYFDFKLFHNGRPGIVAWTLINLSFAAAQYNEIGYVTNSMVLLNFLHAVYVLDFFYHEDWYLRTIDIAHDHFGFYLAWGDSVWLPYMYTLQSHFLLRHPLDLSFEYFSLVFTIGMVGYYIFRTVNNQKDIVRSTNGKCLIWGKPAEYIRTNFVTSDGKVHGSLLLTSGYWGISRHFNYVGDLLMSLAFCMTCGYGYILPYFYIVYMTILLCQRIERDHLRLCGKYGKYWDQYCQKVPYKLIPFIY